MKILRFDWIRGQQSIPDGTWKMLPRWMRMWQDRKPHQGERERERRRRQIERNILKRDSRGAA